MNFETLFQLDPKMWPIAVMACLRVTTIFFFLPLFGEKAVPGRLRVLLAVGLSIILWPIIELHTTTADKLMQWNAVTLAIATMREVFFGFAVGFAARLITFAVQIAANIVGLNMGFQAATLYSPFADHQESAFSAFQGWIVLTLLFTLNVHHVFIEGIASSFVHIPIGIRSVDATVAKLAVDCISESFSLGLRLAAPVITIQIITTLGLGLVNRVIPQLNVFIINYPLSFVVSMLVLLFSTATYVRVLGTVGLEKELLALSNMHKAFHPGVSK